MKFLHKYGTRRNEIRRARKELYGRLSLVVAALVFFALMILITKFRPRTEESQESPSQELASFNDSSSDSYLISLREKVDSVFAEYQAKVSDGTDELEAVQLLDEAISLQNEVIRSRTSDIVPRADIVRLEELQSIKDEVMGKYLIAQSLRQEKEARDEWEAGNLEVAHRLLKRAINVQREINELYPRSSGRNSSRMHELSGLLLQWQTQPIADKADLLMAEAFQMVDSGDYSAARRKIRQALNEQKFLQEEYRKSRYSTLTRMRSFEEAVMKVDAAEDVAAVADLIRVAENVLHSGDHETAFANSVKAEILQQGIVDKYRSTDDEKTELLKQIQMLKDTAASTPAFHRIQSLGKETRNALRNQDMDSFKTLVADWSRETTVIFRKYKQSRLLKDIDTREVELLYQLRSEIPSILEMILNNLVPVPGNNNLKLYKTEVPQALYESVTGQNPSTVKDALKPVDSATWEEAFEFTGMLSMILAHPVILPDEKTYRAAVGEVSLQTIRRQAWASENSNRLVQRCGQLSPNPAGYYDLLGNVSEWLSNGISTRPAQVNAFGGSARDSSARLISIPEDSRSPDERNRYIGFRFIVDYQAVSK